MDKQVRFSPDQRGEIWDRVNAGESVKSIARADGASWARCIGCSRAPAGSVRPSGRALRGGCRWPRHHERGAGSTMWGVSCSSTKSFAEGGAQSSPSLEHTHACAHRVAGRGAHAAGP